MEKEREFSPTEIKRIKQWMYNIEKSILDRDVIQKAWSIGIFQMYTNETMIENYKKIRKTKACLNWKKQYLQQRLSFSDEQKKELVDKRIFSMNALNRRISAYA